MQTSLLQVTLFLALILAGCESPAYEQAEKTALAEQHAPDVDAMQSAFTQRGYKGRYAFYADLQRPSSSHRFFVIDMVEGKIVDRGLTLHGRENPDGSPMYSNVPDSNCSSHGMVKVSWRYHGAFGKSYKLEGLEPSTSNVFRRAVVLHSWSGVPDAPVSGKLINSQGCPTVSPAYLERLEGYIQANRGAVWLFMN
jgi:hypothetical protein